jgi:hypothetical protein
LVFTFAKKKKTFLFDQTFFCAGKRRACVRVWLTHRDGDEDRGRREDDDGEEGGHGGRHGATVLRVCGAALRTFCEMERALPIQKTAPSK